MVSEILKLFDSWVCCVWIAGSVSLVYACLFPSLFQTFPPLPTRQPPGGMCMIIMHMTCKMVVHVARQVLRQWWIPQVHAHTRAGTDYAQSSPSVHSTRLTSGTDLVPWQLRQKKVWNKTQKIFKGKKKYLLIIIVVTILYHTLQDGTFIIRDSSKVEGEYSLSIFHTGGVRHLRWGRYRWFIVWLIFYYFFFIYIGSDWEGIGSLC